MPKGVYVRTKPAKLGRPAWNKGLTKENNPSVAAMAEKLRGKPTWNTDLTKADARVAAMAEKHAEKMRGRTAKTHPHLAVMAEKLRGRTAATHAGVAAGAEKRRWRTAANDPRVATRAEKMRGRTAANDPSRAAQADKMRGRFVADKNPNWQGGLSFEPYDPAFNDALKDSIRQRDGYKCQLCGVPEAECITKLICHHTDYVKRNTNHNNLISLCHSCHNKTGTNRPYWKKYFQHKLRRKKFTIVISWIPKAIKQHKEVPLALK